MNKVRIMIDDLKRTEFGKFFEEVYSENHDVDLVPCESLGNVLKEFGILNLVIFVTKDDGIQIQYKAECVSGILDWYIDTEDVFEVLNTKFTTDFVIRLDKFGKLNNNP